ncbi:MAG TPA: GerMN domain-containing protein, partial [bacterium]|nr:GerMN domain-containing protein [bacterium]
MRRNAAFRIAALGLALLAGACGRKAAAPGSTHSPLYTGEEPKRKVQLTLPSRQQAGFIQVDREIYATASEVNQGKQLLQALLDGPLPGEANAAPCFGPQAAYLELYLDNKGLAVVDLPQSTVDGLPGGTSAEVAVLYCLIRTLSQNLPQVARVQILIDGQVPESLRGHMDLQDPLSLG